MCPADHVLSGEPASSIGQPSHTPEPEASLTHLVNSAEREYVAGLATPGAATFGINTDTSDPNHIALYEIKQAGLTVQWAIGLSDGTAAPTVDSDGFVLPTTRSWITFEGFMNAFPFTFALNAVIASSVGIQVSGAQALIPKTT